MSELRYPLPTGQGKMEGMERRDGRGLPTLLLLALMGSLLLIALVVGGLFFLVLQPAQEGLGPLSVIAPQSDPATVGLDFRRAIGQNDFATQWQLMPPAFQQQHPEQAWIVEQQRAHSSTSEPKDARYKVAGVTTQAIYRRVVVVVIWAGQPPTPGEVDLRQFEGRWAVVDYGDPDHEINDPYPVYGG